VTRSFRLHYTKALHDEFEFWVFKNNESEFWIYESKEFEFKIQKIFEFLQPYSKHTWLILNKLCALSSLCATAKCLSPNVLIWPNRLIAIVSVHIDLCKSFQNVSTSQETKVENESKLKFLPITAPRGEVEQFLVTTLRCAACRTAYAALFASLTGTIITCTAKNRFWKKKL